GGVGVPPSAWGLSGPAGAAPRPCFAPSGGRGAMLVLATIAITCWSKAIAVPADGCTARWILSGKIGPGGVSRTLDRAGCGPAPRTHGDSYLPVHKRSRVCVAVQEDSQPSGRNPFRICPADGKVAVPTLQGRSGAPCGRRSSGPGGARGR